MTWQTDANFLKRTWTFKGFPQALAFAMRAAEVFEEHQHHADLLLSYNKVTISSTTHDAGNTITEKDYKLAEALDELKE